MIVHALIKGHKSERLWRYLIYSFSFRVAEHHFVRLYISEFWELLTVHSFTPFTWWIQSSDETFWECGISSCLCQVTVTLPFLHFLLTEPGFWEAGGVCDKPEWAMSLIQEWEDFMPEPIPLHPIVCLLPIEQVALSLPHTQCGGFICIKPWFSEVLLVPTIPLTLVCKLQNIKKQQTVEACEAFQIQVQSTDNSQR